MELQERHFVNGNVLHPPRSGSGLKLLFQFFIQDIYMLNYL